MASDTNYVRMEPGLNNQGVQRRDGTLHPMDANGQYISPKPTSKRNRANGESNGT